MNKPLIEEQHISFPSWGKHSDFWERQDILSAIKLLKKRIAKKSDYLILHNKLSYIDIVKIIDSCFQLKRKDD